MKRMSLGFRVGMDLGMKIMLLKDDVSLHEATIMIIWDAK